MESRLLRCTLVPLFAAQALLAATYTASWSSIGPHRTVRDHRSERPKPIQSAAPYHSVHIWQPTQ
jgi:hypothetical protein